MKKFLVLTIDVEPDCTPSWRYAKPLSFDGVKTGIRERLQPLFNRYGIAPTYLINNVVLEDRESMDILGSLNGNIEWGTHLHPEFIEPAKEFHQYAGCKAEANCCFYPPEIESAKIENITALFVRQFGYRPLSFRAGRFSAGANTLDTLARSGYKTDTSVTPHVLWQDPSREYPVDYRNAPEQPYFVKPGTVLEQDPGAALLQVPVSITRTRASIFQELRRTRFGLRSPLQKYRPVWLRPFYSSSKELVWVADTYVRQYAGRDFLILNMMFHNVEVVPGLSPYSKTELDCKAYMDQLEYFFKYCYQEGITAIKLSDVYDLYRER